MTGECRPPEGTPDGAWCILRHNRRTHRKWLYASWRNNAFRGSGFWCWPDIDAYRYGAIEAHQIGWRFHSIAEVPHD